MPEPTDVLVVGGGPVGVTVALLAVGRGLTARVLERTTDVYHLPRAVVMDDEVQRIFQGAGLLDGLAAVTTPLLGAEYVATDGTRLMGFDVPEPGAGPLGHHPVVCFDQPELEAWLRAEAVAAGVDLRLGVTVDGVGQDESGAWAEAAGERHDARWLVAADGAGSPTRKALGIPFVDQGYDQEWLVVDMEVDDDVGLPGHVRPQLVGRQLPQPWLGADDGLGDGWAVLSRAGAGPEALGARLVASELAGPAGGIVVRPDRYVAAVAETDEDLREALAAVAETDEDLREALAALGAWFDAGVPA